MRDVNITNVMVSPVTYNPVTNKIKVYSHIGVEITCENANIPATLEMKDKYHSPMFHTVKEAVINPMNMRNEFNITPIKYLIIAHDMFANNEQLMAFVNWKKRIGYLVEVAYTSTTGTTTTAISNSEFMNALVLLDERCGNPSRGTRSIEGNLEMPTQNFTLQQLLDSAFKNRSDLRVAEESVSLAEQEEKLAIRERIPDVELVLGANYNTRVRNEEAPAPPFMGYSVGLTIPLPVLSVNAGVRKASMLRQQQAKLQSQSIRNSIQGEVVRAYNVYQASLQKVKVYNDVLMVNAQEVWMASFMPISGVKHLC